MIKAKVPEQVCDIIDQAMQVHGATGHQPMVALSGMYAQQRTLRYADGPMKCTTTSSPATKCKTTKTAIRVRTRQIREQSAGQQVCADEHV